MNENKRPEFGQRITFKGRATKKHYRLHGENRTRWHSGYDWKPRETGIYIGWRTVSEGVTRIDYDLDGQVCGKYFTATTYKEVYLIAINDRTNPIRIFPDQVIDDEHIKSLAVQS